MEAVNLKLKKQEKFTKELKPSEKATEVLELLHKPLNPEALQMIECWFLDTETYLNLYLTSSVIEFTVIQAILTKNIFKNFNIPDAKSRLSKSLHQSRLILTNKTVDLIDLTRRLPKSVLATSDRDGVLFHQCSFHNDQRHNFFETVHQISVNYIPRIKDLIYGVIFMLLLYSMPLLLELAVGLFVGYCFSSLMEYYVHQNIGHAGPIMKRFFKKLGAVGEDMAHFSLEHSVHHSSVHVNYANPFAPVHLEEPMDFVNQVKNRRKIDEIIFKRGGEKLLSRIEKSQYGLRSSDMWRTHLFFFPISVLVLLLIEYIFSNSTSLVFSLGFLLISTFWITASSVYHPCLHFTEEKIDKDVHFILRWFLKTRISRFIAHSHRMHHAHGGELNQNLNIGFDYLFAWAPLTTPELIDLKKRKTIY